MHSELRAWFALCALFVGGGFALLGLLVLINPILLYLHQNIVFSVMFLVGTAVFFWGATDLKW
jgi:NADH:ubiquinone oxidoreductase subunit 6 (subunit J)